MNALLFAPSGGGKTVNSTLVKADKRNKNVLICTDNSSIVLKNFERPNLDIVDVHTAKDFVDTYHRCCDEKKYDNIILDNLSDLFDMWILEMAEDPKAAKDVRQHYQIVYQALKRLTRESTAAESNTIFTCWSDIQQITLPDGSQVQRMQPKLPYKILDNVCGLMNVVGLVTSAMDGDKKRWYYALEGSQTLMAKDQIGCRKSCLPENLFTL